MKTAIVTGGSRGIGKAMAEKLAEMGYNVAINYVSDSSKAPSEQFAKWLEREYGVKAIAIQGDVSDYDACKNITDTAIKELGPDIQVLVNNAGIDHNRSFLDVTPQEYTRLVNVNLMSYMHMSHLVLPHMIKNKSGNIINVSSIAGMMGLPGQAEYCASKSGVIGLTRALAAEFASANIRVNGIAPGMIMTDMLKNANPQAIQSFRRMVPMGTIGDVEDVSGAMEYLITAKYMTGQTISPNGGLVMQ